VGGRGAEGEKRENLRQTPHQAQSLTWDPIYDLEIMT